MTKDFILEIHQYALNNNLSFTELERIFNIDRKKLPLLFKEYNLDYTSPYDKNSLSKEKQDKVYKLFFSEQLTIQNISDTTGISCFRIKKFLKTFKNYNYQIESNIKHYRSMNSKLDDCMKVEVFNLFFEKNKTITYIIQKTQVSRNTITTYLKQFDKYEKTVTHNKKLNEQNVRCYYYPSIHGPERNSTRDNIVYKYSNVVNGKTYIGITCHEEKRIIQHQMARDTCAFHSAVRKYGYDKFKYEVLDRDLTRFEAEQKEISYIKKYNSYKNGYNSTLGGEAGFKYYFSHKEIEDMYKKYKSGKSLDCVGEEYDITRGVVKRLFKSNNLKLRDSQSKIREDRLGSLEKYSEKIVNMYICKYKSLKEIAKYMSYKNESFTYSQNDIKTILENYNVTLRNGNSKIERLSNENIKELCNDYTNEKSIKFISQKYHISRKSVEQILINHNISIKSA